MIHEVSCSETVSFQFWLVASVVLLNVYLSLPKCTADGLPHALSSVVGTYRKPSTFVWLVCVLCNMLARNSGFHEVVIACAWFVAFRLGVFDFSSFPFSFPALLLFLLLLLSSFLLPPFLPSSSPPSSSPLLPIPDSSNAGDF